MPTHYDVLQTVMFIIQRNTLSKLAEYSLRTAASEQRFLI